MDGHHIFSLRTLAMHRAKNSSLLYISFDIAFHSHDGALWSTHSSKGGVIAEVGALPISAVGAKGWGILPSHYSQNLEIKHILSFGVGSRLCIHRFSFMHIVSILKLVIYCGEASILYRTCRSGADLLLYICEYIIQNEISEQNLTVTRH